MPKTDCFAYAHKGAFPWCKCLNEMLCAKGNCTFYKSKLKFAHDLVEHNGTTDLRKISEDYAAGHVERGV